MVKKPKQGANYAKFIKSTLYSPARLYPIIGNDLFTGLDPQPSMITIAPKDVIQTPVMISSKFGSVRKGSVLSYQQKLSQEYAINDFFSPPFPT